VDALDAYLPADRRQAWARGEALPDRARGAVLLADVSGFTALTEALTRALGPRLGAEELLRRLNRVYDALIAEVDRYRGSVVGFSGDAMTCWFDGDDGRAATTCALAMQAAMRPFAAPPAEVGAAPLAIKVAVASGPARRLLVGDPAIQRIDVLAGATVARAAAGAQMARTGEVVVDEPTAAGADAGLRVLDWRVDPVTGERFVAVGSVSAPAPAAPWPRLEPGAPPAAEARAWLLPEVFARLEGGHGEFLTELRPAVPLFLAFAGIDYDGDEEAGGKLDAFVRWVQTVLTRYGGALIQLTIGDKGSYLQAVFGAPIAHEDDARRAVAAARELSAPPPALAFIAEVRIGVSQGTMRTGAYGGATRRTYGVQGDEVNVAARLMEHAEPGQVIAGGRVAAATRRAFGWIGLPPLTVKGKAEPVAVARLAPAAPESASPAQLVGAMVGRTAERALIADCLDSLLRAGAQRGATLVIEGEAGIGKSRLVDDVRDQARARGVRFLLGAGDAIEQATPFHAWRGVVGQLLGLDGSAEPAAQRAQVERALAAAPDRLRLAPLLNPALPFALPDNDLTASLEGQARADATRELILDLIEDACRREAMALVVDDAHWLDSASWALAAAVGRRGLPMLFALVTRPPSDPAPGYRETLAIDGARRLQLDALSPGEALTLACRRLGVAALPEPAAELIVEKAQGNPLFGEELASALRDGGWLLVRDGDCELAPGVADLRAVDFPDTVQGVITSRIDRLAPAEQLTLKVASVIGRQFTFETVRAVHPATDDARLLTVQLDALDRLGFTPVSEPAPDPTYAFKHVIIQEAAYNLMLFEQRRALHRAVGEWCERTFADAPAPPWPVLAHHWSRAGVAPKAIDYLEKSATQALSNGMPKEAGDFGLDAARLLGLDIPRDPRAIGPAIGAALGEIEALMAGREVSDLIDLPRSTDPDLTTATRLVLQSQPAVALSQQNELFVLMALENLIATLRHGNNPFSPGVYAVYATVRRGMTGDSRAAYALSRLALDLDARQGGLLTAYVGFVHTWFINHWLHPIETNLAMSLDASRAGFERGDIVFGCFNLAAHTVYVSVMGAPLDEVIAVAARDGAVIADRVHSAAFHCRHELQLAKALAGRTVNRLSFTDAECDEARDLEPIVRTASYNQTGYYYVSKLRLHYYYGDYAAALGYADLATRLLPSFQGQVGEVELVFFQALALLAAVADAGDEERRALRDAAHANLARLRDWSDLCEANFDHKRLLVEAELARVTGRSAEALRLYREAQRSAERFGYVQHAALADELAGRCCLASADEVAARARLAAARAAYARWGARAKVEDLDARYGSAAPGSAVAPQQQRGDVDLGAQAQQD
jgi:predicted ATPase/class 3 adenylate cyclase